MKSDDKQFFISDYYVSKHCRWPKGHLHFHYRQISTAYPIKKNGKKQKEVAKEKEQRKRSITIFVMILKKMSRKLIYSGLLQSVLTESDNTNAGGFFVRKLANKVDSNCYENLIIFLFLKGQGFCTFNIYAGFRERRCRLNACG